MARAGRLRKRLALADPLDPTGVPYVDRAAEAIDALEEAVPDDLRGAGWAVAVHNDYRQDGEPHTFWLFTKGERAIKGEGSTDAKALNQVRTALASDTAACWLSCTKPQGHDGPHDFAAEGEIA